jgi:hypothetical protein
MTRRCDLKNRYYARLVYLRVSLNLELVLQFFISAVKTGLTTPTGTGKQKRVRRPTTPIFDHRTVPRLFLRKGCELEQ